MFSYFLLTKRKYSVLVLVTHTISHSLIANTFCMWKHAKSLSVLNSDYIKGFCMFFRSFFLALRFGIMEFDAHFHLTTIVICRIPFRNLHANLLEHFVFVMHTETTQKFGLTCL